VSVQTQQDSQGTGTTLVGQALPADAWTVQQQRNQATVFSTGGAASQSAVQSGTWSAAQEQSRNIEQDSGTLGRCSVGMQTEQSAGIGGGNQVVGGVNQNQNATGYNIQTCEVIQQQHHTTAFPTQNNAQQNVGFTSQNSGSGQQQQQAGGFQNQSSGSAHQQQYHSGGFQTHSSSGNTQQQTVGSGGTQQQVTGSFPAQSGGTIQQQGFHTHSSSNAQHVTGVQAQSGGGGGVQQLQTGGSSHSTQNSGIIQQQNGAGFQTQSGGAMHAQDMTAEQLLSSLSAQQTSSTFQQQQNVGE